MAKWTALANQPPFNASTMLLLTDGTVLCQDEGPASSGSPNWWKLTPDPLGSYQNGTWAKVATGPNSPLYYASGVLRDGRVFVAGGEYNGQANSVDLLAAEIYDPVADTWAPLGTPAGWTNIGDAPCCVLPDGRVLLGNSKDNLTAIYDPAANSWTAAAAKGDLSSEEAAWTLLPDQTILSVQCNNPPNAEKYLIAADRWVPAGATPLSLVEAVSNEIGPALLLPDGRLFAVGATGATALYTMPAVADQPGSWEAGPMFPKDAAGQQLIAKDAPACLLPNGRVLCTGSPQGGCAQSNEGYCPPTYFFEYDPAAPISSALVSVLPPPNADQPVFTGRMLLLPTGEVLFANGSNIIAVYSPAGGPDAVWKPQITDCPTTLARGKTYTLKGRQLNGLSQAVSYGDDATMATNYPLVRLRNLGANSVRYCRTHDFSSMGVATGNVVRSTRFDIPADAALGSSEVCVIANGIPSDPRPVAVTGA